VICTPYELSSRNYNCNLQVFIQPSQNDVDAKIAGLCDYRRIFT